MKGARCEGHVKGASEDKYEMLHGSVTMLHGKGIMMRRNSSPCSSLSIWAISVGLLVCRMSEAMVTTMIFVSTTATSTPNPVVGVVVRFVV